ncbi:YczE/YyaS/YitT family protein [Desulfuribacillus alkaliarsenatis]|uniref:YitT family protein n=1 Tax=Desulfuribacillus alkaliarsenatis TaxID=766136 RepID=A0A1E5G1J7_9FIRM|nr:hypothetical protein [Desulfuribacillus alkaliarsenatis]OEF96318.1 hypothetical protein BHF68_09165 [Desulfuribacillus alkaliarsenatis]
MINYRRIILQWVIFFVGIMVMSYGIVLTIVANLGVSPWDVFHLGLANTTPLTPGMAVQVTGIIIVIIVCFLMKRYPQIGTILNMIFVGVFIDVFLLLPVTPTGENLFQQLAILVIGTVLFGVGAGIYISSNLGAGPRDGLVLVLNIKKGWSIGRIKTVMELSALGFGALLGGPVGVGTVIISLTIGPIMGFNIEYWKGLLGKYTEEVKSNEVVNER